MMLATSRIILLSLFLALQVVLVLGQQTSIPPNSTNNVTASTNSSADPNITTTDSNASTTTSAGSNETNTPTTLSTQPPPSSSSVMPTGTTLPPPPETPSPYSLWLLHNNSNTSSETIVVTKTLSGVTESLSTSETVPSPTITVTESVALPTKPPFVFFRTAVRISADCFLDTIASASNKICRTVVFEMKNDGFPRTSEPFTFAVKYDVMRHGGGGYSNPFGIKAQWEQFITTANVISNVTHLFVELAENSGLQIIEKEYVVFNFSTSSMTLRGEVPSYTNNTYTITILPPTNIESSEFLYVGQLLGGLLGATSVLLPTNPSLPDVQLGILMGSSYCSEQNVQLVSQRGQRVLWPSAEASDDARTRLAHNSALLGSIAALHLGFVLAVMLKGGIGFLAACNAALFPSVTVSVAIMLLPGIVHAGVHLLISSSSDRADRAIGFFGTFFTVNLCLLPIVFHSRVFRATCRAHDIALWQFPMGLRLCMPEYSWGPNSLTHSWLVPLCSMHPERLNFVTLSMIYESVVAAILAIEPMNPSGCGVLFLGIIIAVFIHMYVVLRYLPYRSRYVNAATAFSSFLFLVALFINMGHAFAPTERTGRTVAAMLAYSYVWATFRSLGAIVAAVIELKIIRPKVWPDRKRADGKDYELDAMHSAHIEWRSEALDSDVVDRVQTYVAPHKEVIEPTEEERAEAEVTLVFQEPPARPPRPLSKVHNPKKILLHSRSAAQLHEPMLNVLRNTGAVPPAVFEQRKKDYDIL